MSEVKQAFAEAYLRYKQYAMSRSKSDLRKFHSAFREAVIRFARKHIPQSSHIASYVATDLVNDTFLKLEHEALIGKEFDSALDLQKHALTVIRNTYLTYARTKRARRMKLDPRSLDDIQITDPAKLIDPTWEAQFLNEEALIQIDAAMNDLERVDKSAAEIALYFVYGVQDQNEIASILEIHPRTVKRAILKLRARLQAVQ